MLAFEKSEKTFLINIFPKIGLNYIFLIISKEYEIKTQ